MAIEVARLAASLSNQDYVGAALEARTLAEKANGIGLDMPPPGNLNLNSDSQVISDRERAKAGIQNNGDAFIRTARVFNDAEPGSSLAIATAEALATYSKEIWRLVHAIRSYEKWLSRDESKDHGGGITGGNRPGFSIGEKAILDKIDSVIDMLENRK